MWLSSASVAQAPVPDVQPVTVFDVVPDSFTLKHTFFPDGALNRPSVMYTSPAPAFVTASAALLIA